MYMYVLKSEAASYIYNLTLNSGNKKENAQCQRNPISIDDSDKIYYLSGLKLRDIENQHFLSSGEMSYSVKLRRI